MEVPSTNEMIDIDDCHHDDDDAIEQRSSRAQTPLYHTAMPLAPLIDCSCA